MRPFRFWLTRAAADAPALILPGDRRWRYADLDRMTPRQGLSLLAGSATEIAAGLLAAAKGSGTAFPLPPHLPPHEANRLSALARAEASPRIALIIATSGSTGTPKGVKLSWRAITAAARASTRALAFGPGDVWLCPLPLYHIGGAMIIYRTLHAGATAVIHERFDPLRIGEDLTRHAVTHLSLVPAMLAKLLEADVRPPATLRVALLGGAALSTALFRQARAVGWPVVPSYGMSETCAVVALHREAGADWREGDVGRPLPGTRIRLSADGRIEIATLARMTGYLGEPQPSGEWLLTNDLGSLDERGHLRVLGRADEMLITGGVKVHPLVVEQRLAACPGIGQAAVIGVPDPAWGQILACAYTGSIEPSALERWCREELPSSHRPRRFRRLVTLPQLPSGKPDRRALASLWKEER